MKYDTKQNNETRKIRIAFKMLATMYESGMTVKEIADSFKVSVQPIKRILREGGLIMRPAIQRKGQMSGNKNPSWKGGRRIRSDGYVILWTPEGEQLEHRVVMEQILGRKLLSSEIVHHKDHNRSNNSPTNLELIESQAKHALRHGKENRETLLKHGLKQCTACFQIKELSEFYTTKFNAMGIQSWCKKCKNERDSRTKKQKRDR